MATELSEMTLEELWELFPVITKEHNVKYKQWYEVEKLELMNSIDSKNIIRITHIGSSAVEGLISKPTIDILLEVNLEADIVKLKAALNKKGWTLMSSQKNPYMQISFNKGYTNEGYAEKVYHLHVRYYDAWNEIYFRDYLIENKVTADEYGLLKKELLKKFEHHRDGYTVAKSDFISKYTEKAKEKYGDRYKSKDI